MKIILKLLSGIFTPIAILGCIGTVIIWIIVYEFWDWCNKSYSMWADIPEEIKIINKWN